MSNVDPSKLKFSTLFGYLLNYNYDDDTTYSVVVPAKTYSAGEVTSHNLSIPVDATRDFTQVRINFSFDSDKWYTFPIGNDLLFGSLSIPVVGSYGSNSLNLTIFVVNSTGGSIPMPSFTASSKALLFIEPI